MVLHEDLSGYARQADAGAVRSESQVGSNYVYNSSDEYDGDQNEHKMQLPNGTFGFDPLPHGEEL